MSKIFDALQREGGQLSDTILTPMLPQTVTSVPPAPGRNHNGEAREPADSSGRLRPEPIADYKTAQLAAERCILVFLRDERAAQEQYRIVRTKIAHHPAKPRVVLVSSAAAADGKTTTAINLAAALSLKSDGDVLLVDGDLRRPAVASQLGLPVGPGLADVLSGTCSMHDAIVRTKQFPFLCVLTAGEVSTNPAEMLDSAQWSLLCASARKAFRYIVLDSPPISAVADYDLLQTMADGIILTATPDWTPRKMLFRALETVAKEKLIGVVLDRVPRWFLWKSHGHRYYDYYSAGR